MKEFLHYLLMADHLLFQKSLLAEQVALKFGTGAMSDEKN